ncbi:MAG: ATP-binding cassette domain-containing protein, partial [Halieaceae bacterium]|nr:ATP-binding cassette domain-containing protein [Halieaceae bacterium]
MSTEPLLELHGVNLVYRALPALRDINWRPLQGQQWACLGPNGAGKTSLARVLCSQATHYSGDFQRAPQLDERGVAYVCFEQAKALCDRDRKLDDSEFRADASDPGTAVQAVILGGKQPDERFHHWVERLHIGHILQRGLRF